MKICTDSDAMFAQSLQGKGSKLAVSFKWILCSVILAVNKEIFVYI